MAWMDRDPQQGLILLEHFPLRGQEDRKLDRNADQRLGCPVFLILDPSRVIRQSYPVVLVLLEHRQRP